MHSFEDLIYGSTSFTLGALEETNSKIIEALQTSGSTILVKNLQMIQLQKAIFAVGMFSMFDATLQDQLSCRNGFEGAKNVLKEKQKLELHDRFDEFICAINVLKHGDGRSYDALISKSELLPLWLLPVATIFPSTCIAMELITEPIPKEVLSFPSPSKVLSKAPVGVYRARAKSLPLYPPTTIFPSACIAMANTCSLDEPKLVVSFPSPSNVLSKAPAVV